MRDLRTLFLAVVALGLGVAAESMVFTWSDIRHWLPDLATGLAVLASAAVALARSRGASVLLTAVGVAWFLGNVDATFFYWHRAPLLHLLLTYPGWRPRGRVEVGGVIGVYAITLVSPIWRNEIGTTAAAVVLVALVAVLPGRHRRAFAATMVFTASLAGGAVARLAAPSGELVDPTLLLYQAALVAVVVLLTSGPRRPPATEVTDRVVELGEGLRDGLRGALAEVLGDPSLRVGYPVPGAEYFDDDGRPIGPVGPGRTATVIGPADAPIALLVYDESVLAEPELAAAVERATRLSTTHAVLRDEVREQLADLADSRRRLLTAGDAERSRLGQRLRSGPGQQLRDLDTLLTAALVEHPDAGHLRRADEHVRDAVGQLDDLTAGLLPSELEAGLAPAIEALAERCPLTVDVDVDLGGRRFDEKVERAAYFTCAEALSNVAKHASTGRASVAASVQDDYLVVEVVDAGVGGADPAGLGLLGLADRVEATGGHLMVTSDTGGTRLRAEFTLGPGR